MINLNIRSLSLTSGGSGFSWSAWNDFLLLVVGLNFKGTLPLYCGWIWRHDMDMETCAEFSESCSDCAPFELSWRRERETERQFVLMLKWSRFSLLLWSDDGILRKFFLTVAV